MGKKKTIFFKKDKDGKPVVIDPKDYDGKLMVKPKQRMSGGMAIGGGHKNYKMTGMIKAKTGMLTEKQKTLPLHLQKAIKA